MDHDQFQQMTNQYSDKVKEFDMRWEEYDRRSATATPRERDWQKEVEMEESMRLVADMQMALQREIRWVCVCVCECVCVCKPSSFIPLTLSLSLILPTSLSFKNLGQYNRKLIFF